MQVQIPPKTWTRRKQKHALKTNKASHCFLKACMHFAAAVSNAVKVANLYVFINLTGNLDFLSAFCSPRPFCLNSLHCLNLAALHHPLRGAIGCHSSLNYCKLSVCYIVCCLMMSTRTSSKLKTEPYVLAQFENIVWKESKAVNT